MSNIDRLLFFLSTFPSYSALWVTVLLRFSFHKVIV